MTSATYGNRSSFLLTFFVCTDKTTEPFVEDAIEKDLL